MLTNIKKEAITNVRVLHGDAAEILKNHIPEASLSIVQLFFPDPWPKARHHKRRLVQPEFVALVASKLAANGILHIATGILYGILPYTISLVLSNSVVTGSNQALHIIHFLFSFSL